MSVLSQLNVVFRKVFNNQEIAVTPATTANDVEGWDSLSHVNLIVAVEATFGVSFSQKELMKHRCVGDLVRDIEAKIPR